MAATSFRIALVIKGTKSEAELVLVERLNKWFTEDVQHNKGGFEPGSLLWWGIKDADTKEAP